MEDVSQLELYKLEGQEKGSVTNGANSGSLYEVTVCQRTCSAKRLFDVLHEVSGDNVLGEQEVAILAQRFRRECVSLSKLRHPNVLQFIGVHCGPAGPLDVTLVTEHVYMELDQCLQSHPNVDISIKLSVLFDVSCGLLYLHTRDPPIVHRSLTASNVVLTRDLTGKIADLRVSKVFDLEAQVLRLPEVLIYMPPEVLARPPSCDVKMDVFSFGVLCLYVLNEGFATSTGSDEQQASESSDPHATARAMQATKRDRSLEMVGKQHPLYPAIAQCLQGEAAARPGMTEVSEVLQKLCSLNNRKFKDILKSIIDFESRKDLKSLRVLLEEKKDEVYKLSQRLVKVDIDMSKLEMSRAAVLKNRDRKKTSTLTTTMSCSFETQSSRFPVVQLMQDKLKVAEEEKKQLQVEMQKTCLELKSELDACRQALVLKTQEGEDLRARIQQLEKSKDRVGGVDEVIVTSQEVAKVGSGRVDRTPSHDRKGEVTRDGCAACVGLKKKVGELESMLERYQDECMAYQEQSMEQKRQIQFHVDAHEVLSQENAGLKRSLEEELVRVGEQERGRRLSLEKRCADLEVVNDVLRQENLMLFNQNNEMMLTITKCSPETLDQFKTLNGLGTRGGHPEVTLSLLRSPNKSKTPDHWDGIQEGGASSCHGDSDQQVGR